MPGGGTSGARTAHPGRALELGLEPQRVTNPLAGAVRRSLRVVPLGRDADGVAGRLDQEDADAAAAPEPVLHLAVLADDQRVPGDAGDQQPPGLAHREFQIWPEPLVE